MAERLSPDPAQGVFETMLVAGGAPVELDEHLARAGASVRALFGRELPPAARGLALEHAAPLALGRLRATVAPGADGELGVAVVTAAMAGVDVFPGWERAIALPSVPADGGLGAHKWADRSWLAGVEAALPEGRLPLLLDAAGEVLEVSRSNVFALEGETLLTPSADGRILPGIARARVIAIAREHGLEVHESGLRLERLLDAGELFLTNSLRGVEPVGSLDGQPLREPGAAARELARALRERWLVAGRDTAPAP